MTHGSHQHHSARPRLPFPGDEILAMDRRPAAAVDPIAPRLAARHRDRATPTTTG